MICSESLDFHNQSDEGINLLDLGKTQAIRGDVWVVTMS
jgi:hypothetical protein